MDDGHENCTHGGQYNRRDEHTPWNIIPEQHHSLKEQNALTLNKKLLSIIAERDSAIRERNLALSEKKTCLAERDLACAQRELAIEERNNALLERDNAIAALRHHYNKNGILQRSVQEQPTSSQSLNNITTDAFPLSIIALKSKPPKEIIKSRKPVKGSQKRKSLSEDLNCGYVTGSNGAAKKTKNEWDDVQMGVVNLVLDDSNVPPPICSCTGELRQCYKWGNGGWQSSCCTTTLSMYPLPSLAHKRHARMGGRKMSGSVFRRLLGRAVEEGHDASCPLDLKDHWARHGTNRYITIK